MRSCRTEPASGRKNEKEQASERRNGQTDRRSAHGGARTALAGRSRTERISITRPSTHSSFVHVRRQSTEQPTEPTVRWLCRARCLPYGHASSCGRPGHSSRSTHLRPSSLRRRRQHPRVEPRTRRKRRATPSASEFVGASCRFRDDRLGRPSSRHRQRGTTAGGGGGGRHRRASVDQFARSIRSRGSLARGEVDEKSVRSCVYDGARRVGQVESRLSVAPIVN